MEKTNLPTYSVNKSQLDGLVKHMEEEASKVCKENNIEKTEFFAGACVGDNTYPGMMLVPYEKGMMPIFYINKGNEDSYNISLYDRESEPGQLIPKPRWANELTASCKKYLEEIEP